MALFSSARQPQSSHLVEFRAGKMFTRGGGETGAPITVHPDKRKGLVYINQSDDGLMHFCWKDRTTGAVDDDLIVFPEDVEFIRVDQCTTGRVFLLKFKNSPRKLFFWMQEPKSDKDDEYRRKVNELLNNPPVPGSGRSGRGGSGQDSMDQFAMMNQLLGLGGGGGGGRGEERMDLQNALAGMDHQQLMQLLNLMGSTGGAGSSGFGGFADVAPPSVSAPRRVTPSNAPSVTTPAVTQSAATGTASTVSETAIAGNAGGGGHSTTGGVPQTGDLGRQGIQVTDLQNILSGLNVIGPASTEPAVDLEDVLAAKNLESSVRKPENEARLVPHLPDEEPVERTREELLHTIRSPQFHQAVDMFGTALQTGQLAPLMSQFGLPPSAIEACARGDIQSVAEILEREGGAASASSGTAAGGEEKEKKKKADDSKDSGPPPKKDKPDDEHMDLD